MTAPLLEEIQHNSRIQAERGRLETMAMQAVADADFDFFHELMEEIDGLKFHERMGNNAE